MELPSVPHQSNSFDFPKRSFGKKVIVKRSIQASWFDRWSWLHYIIESNDVALCLNCAQAKQQKKLTFSSNADDTFISKGFSNWKDATVKFVQHASSNCHKEAVLKMVSLTTNVAELLSVTLAKEKLERRQCFLKIYTILILITVIRWGVAGCSLRASPLSKCFLHP